MMQSIVYLWNIIITQCVKKSKFCFFMGFNEYFFNFSLDG